MTESRTGRREDAEAAPPADVPEEDVPAGGRWKAVFVALLVVGVLGAVTWVLLGSRLLVVRHVEVTGTDLAPRDRVTAAAGVDLGVPMARLDTGEIRARVERLREVGSAEVERNWPGTVRIVVDERVPVAVFEHGGRYHRIDGQGVVVADGTTRPSGLPALSVGAPGPSDPSTLAALRVLTALPDALRGPVVQVEATAPEAVTLYLNDGRTILWGAAERAEEKIRLLESLQRTEAGRAVRRVDVSSPGVLMTS
ncbi:cell division protein FtsQ/DivIB [Actinomadura sp. WMMB 499]|uniref:cell division protein FtsQ/DivIB n=1 Tax=Actinomadura sp. WMMB 499 TaxID=1219491 RepID=UPI0012484F09|nr:FtsQ-type POTRA domain-containing protein [Actinomadura sp. WMMB 499]QFG25926.1 FtsQ-type POTRA domain-containing protein [Actinomadura sp. WMMB 499]